MQQYSMLQAIFLSFFSRNLYRDVVLNWRKKAFLYLFILLALVCIFKALKADKDLKEYLRTTGEQVINQFPTLHFKEGKINTPENRPYVIKQPNTDKNLIVIDVTSKYSTPKEANADILMKEDEVIIQSSNVEAEHYKYPTSTFESTINPEVMNAVIKKYTNYAWIIFYIAYLIFYYILNILLALINSIFGKFFSSIINISLTYGRILQIALVAFTPPIILCTVFNYFNINFSLQELLYFIISIFYLFYGILANKTHKE